MAKAKANQTEAKGEKRSVADVLTTIFLIVCILIVIVASYSAYTTADGTGVPRLFGHNWHSIQSDSMLPTFAAGDMIIDKVVKDPSTLKEGDVITFWTIINGQRVLNTHRIIAITDYGNYLYFDTKGDNNTIADTTGVHQNDIVGQYQIRLKGMGNVYEFVTSAKGFLICIVIPVAIFFIFQLVSFFRTLTAFQAEKMKLQVQEQAAALAAAQTQAILQAQANGAAQAPAPETVAQAPEAPAEQPETQETQEATAE